MVLPPTPAALELRRHNSRNGVPWQLVARLVNGGEMVQAFPPGFQTEEIETGGATIHLRVGGQGPAVVVLTASATRATCGRRWRQRSCATRRAWLL